MKEKEKEKEHIIFTKERMIKKISAKTEKSFDSVRKFYNALEDSLIDVLSTANEDVDITIKLCEGITINSEFIPEKEKVNNLTGKLIKTKDKIKCKANVTRSYCEKLTTHNK
jgi:hypothetical protein